MKPPLASLFLFYSAVSAWGQDPIRMASDPALSPDGKTLLFAWRGDIWTAATEGGIAGPLTRHPADDSQPHFSPDGKEIAFVSDRSGSPQVWVMPVDGGAPVQRTFHTAGYSLHGWFPDGASLLARRRADTFWRPSHRFFRIPRRGSKAPEMLFDAYGDDGRLSLDGRRLLFTREGMRGRRKGYRGSRASQIWMYDFTEKTFTRIRSHPGGVRSPLWRSDGKGFYYVGAESGTFNLREGRIRSGQTRAVTHFEDDIVSRPALSRDGSTIVFRHLFDLYRLHPGNGNGPIKIELSHRSDDVPPREERRLLHKAASAAFRETGLEIAFVAGGDLWVMDTILREPRAVTKTPGEEREPVFSKDGSALYFVSDQRGRCDLWKAERSRPKRPWWQNESFRLTRLTEDDDAESRLRLSPDGTRLAYVRGRGDLYVMTLKDGRVTRVLEAWSAPQYDWSPDGKWIVYSALDSDYNRDVWIVPVDGSRPPFNVSRHPDNETDPVWSPDGRKIAFTGRREGEEVDLYYVWLRKEDDEKTSRDRKRIKALEKMRGKKPKEAPPVTVRIDWDGMHERVRRVRIPHSHESELVWSPDGTKLAFRATVDGKKGTYTIEVPDAVKPKLLSASTGSGGRWLKKGDRIVWLEDGVPGSLTASGKATRYPFQVKQTIRLVEHRREGFLLAWRAMRDHYYDARLGNRDWNAVRKKYEERAAHSSDLREFSEVVNMMLGELNGSHLGFQARGHERRRSEDAWAEVTPHLGVRWDPAYRGPGLRVGSLIPDGPADQERSRLRVGDVVLKIDEEKVETGTDLDPLLNGPLDRDVRLVVRRGEAKPRLIRIRPIAYTAVSELLYRAWVRANRKKVEGASHGKLGYVHIRGMTWPSALKFERELYSIGAGKDGIVIDVRENGGGFTTDHLLTMLTQPLHAVTVGRGGAPGYPQDRKVYASWYKPIVVLCNQNSFSNAEIFCHAIKTLKRGKLVGAPTAGGVISTGSRPILDLGRLRMPTRGWFLAATGEDMERNGAVPDFILWPEPGEFPAGKDRQLDKAIEVLRVEVAEWNARARPRPRYASEKR